MTLLSICQEVLSETKNATIPQTIVGNLESGAIQILQAVKVAAIEISRSYSWQALQREHNFASTATTEGYDLPSDFDRMIDSTFWNLDSKMPISGITTPQGWLTLKSSSISSGSYEHYRIRNGQILLFPTPSSVENYVFEYISNNIIKGADNTPKTNFSADTDYFIIDEHILRLDATWRFLNKQGRPYAEEQRTANLAIADRAKIDGGRAKIYANTTRSLDTISSLPHPIIPI